jgi:hypothetical protein
MAVDHIDICFSYCNLPMVRMKIVFMAVVNERFSPLLYA